MIKCNVCDSPVTRVLISKDGYDIFQCDNCLLAFTYPLPECIDEQYDSSYFGIYRRRRPFRLKRADARLKVIELMAAPGKILDIGCSLGYVVEAAAKRGWEASGIEISEAAAKEAQEINLDVQAGILAETTYAENTFDCATMWDVLEHIPDPTHHMKCVNRILKPGGIVAIGTPNIAHLIFKLKKENWRHLKPAEHIYYFQLESLVRLLEKTGFKITNPPVFNGRTFDGSFGIGIKNWLARTCSINDVITVYGVKNGVQVSADRSYKSQDKLNIPA